jgi:hypothetical protein
MPKYLHSNEVALHNSADDCYVSIHGSVLDLTEFLANNRGPLAQPIIEHAGKDISYWFDKNGDGPVTVKTYVDPDRNLTLPYTPMGRFLHVPPPTPDSDWDTDFGTPWWCNENFVIGQLSAKSRKINVVNTLTQQEYVLEVCSEETISEIQDRYIAYNGHAASYTWKRLTEDGEKFIGLDMDKNLEDNGIIDEDLEFEKLHIPDDFYVPVIHIYYNDDLTIA